jgi:DNA segregation ATPase FtsK/SpoIIIE-like protein
MSKIGYYFKAMPNRKKLIFARAVILILITIVMVIDFTKTKLIGVFGYMSYGYLAIAYIFFIADLIKKGKWKETPSKRRALVACSFFSIVLTIHIAFLRDAIDQGFSEYIAAVYNNPSVGGVIMSLISAPIVIPCKYIASSIIFFSLSLLLCFFVVYPYIFVNSKNKKPKEKISLIDLENKDDENKDEAREPSEEEQKILERLNLKNEPINPPTYVDLKENAGKKLFGDDYVSTIPNIPKQDEILPKNLLKEKDKNPYIIAEDIEALKIKPNSTLYSNSYLNRNEEKARKEAADKLKLGSQDFYRSLYNEQEPTVEEEIKPTMKMNDYIPIEVIYDDSKKEEDTKDNNLAEKFNFDGEFEEQILCDNEIQDNNDNQYNNDNKYNNKEPIHKEQTKVMEQQAYKKERISVVEKPKKISKKQELMQEELKLNRPYHFPSKELLVNHTSKGFVPYVDNIEELREVIEVKLRNYNIEAKFVDAIKGPTITRCIVDLDDKCPISKVISAKPDINRLLMTKQEITILPQMDNSPYFGIEVPNKIRGIVSFKEVIASKEYFEAKGDILIALGKTADGRILVEDLADMPHALIAGSTGSGKSVCINVILASILFRYSPDEVKLMLIDLKRVEMELFGGLPHMLVDKPLDNISEIMNALTWLREEVERRFIAFKGIHVRKLSEYNESVEPNQRIPRIVVIIDEASELMTNPIARKPVEASLSSLARVARAAGVHLVFATQNPVKEVITNEIQNNLNTKIAFAVGDYNHSMVIFKAKGAECLLGNGDMYIKRGKEMVRGQCAYISTEEVEGIVEEIKENNDVEFDYDAIDRILRGSKEEIAPINEAGKGNYALNNNDANNVSDGKQELIKETLRICVQSGRASCSLVQRKLQKGYNTIANVMDYLEEKGWVSEQVNNKRNLLITKQEFLEMYPDLQNELEGDDK